MPFASGATTRVAYIAETAYGTTPATPVFKNMRVTGGGLRTNKTTGRSNDLNPDRNIRDEFQLAQGVSGAYPFEMTDGNFDDLIEAALMGAWATNVLVNGTTRRSFTFEETIELGATDSFSRFTGCMISRFSLDIAARAAITGSFDLIGQKEAPATAIITGATYTAANSNKTVMTGSGSVGTATVSGVPGIRLRRLTFEVQNNLRERPVLGSLYTEEPGEGLCDVTGSFEAYFESNTLYQRVLDHLSSAITCTIGHVANQKYTISIPAAQLLDGSRAIGGNNDDVIATVPFRGTYNAGIAGSISITRAVA